MKAIILLVIIFIVYFLFIECLIVFKLFTIVILVVIAFIIVHSFITVIDSQLDYCGFDRLFTALFLTHQINLIVRG